MAIKGVCYLCCSRAQNLATWMGGNTHKGGQAVRCKALGLGGASS